MNTANDLVNSTIDNYVDDFISRNVAICKQDEELLQQNG